MSSATYWHLTGGEIPPSDYDVVTSKLLTYPTQGVAVQSRVARWCGPQQATATIQYKDWEIYSDPRQTTYRTYIERAREREALIDALLDKAEATDAQLAANWVQSLGRILPPLRFPLHGLQMTAAYIGSMAPAGKIAVCALFQAADEMRLLQRVAYRTRQLQMHHPDFGKNARQIWQEEPQWQPLRKGIEQLLVTYDWTEALILLALVFKPLMAGFFLVHLAELAFTVKDDTLNSMLTALHADQVWHSEWSGSLLSVALKEPENRRKAEEFLSRRGDLVSSIVESGQMIFADAASYVPQFDVNRVKFSALAEMQRQRQSVGLYS
ncbi:MAG TPA: hypothetical protein VL137_04655 [Polyangiaceae bacterium]|nr:hypothetical protein [Polyangiaceae bacterium]